MSIRVASTHRARTGIEDLAMMLSTGSIACARCVSRFGAANAPLARGSRRLFSTTRSVRETIKDPQHPTGLWYHSVEAQDGKQARWAVSLLPDTPSKPDAPAVLGLLSASGAAPHEAAAASAENFVTNGAFVQELHNILKNDIVPTDQSLDFEVKNRESGWAHLTDARHALMPGRIATPENIFASVAFTESTLHLDSYQPNETYRVLTKDEGWMQLREEWLPIICKRLKQMN